MLTIISLLIITSLYLPSLKTNVAPARKPSQKETRKYSNHPFHPMPMRIHVFFRLAIETETAPLLDVGKSSLGTKPKSIGRQQVEAFLFEVTLLGCPRKLVNG